MALLREWLWARRGMIALGLRPSSSPIIPERGMADIRDWFSDGEYLWDCPVCGGAAVGRIDGPLWCEEHGVVEIDVSNRLRVQ